MRMGTLNVYKREGMRNDDLVWTLSGHQGSDWHEALVDIGGACYQVGDCGITLYLYPYPKIAFNQLSDYCPKWLENNKMYLTRNRTIGLECDLVQLFSTLPG